MVFRAVFVGWLLILGAVCLGQEGQAAQGLERLQASDEMEIAGKRVRLVLHRSTFPAFINEPGWSGSGFMVTAVPADSLERPTVVWAGTPPLMHIRETQGTVKRSGFLWDSEAQQLWVFAALTIGFEQHAVTVNRLEFDRDAADGTLNVIRRATATESFSFDKASDLRADSVRFVRADDGGVDLVLRYPDETETTLDLTRNVRDEAVAGKLAVNERLREAVLSDLRANPLKSVRFVGETDELRIDGHAVRFAMHWASATEKSSFTGNWLGAGYIVSIVPAAEAIEPTPLWKLRAPTTEIHIPAMVFGAFGERTAIWWDDPGQRLWVATAFTSGKGPQVIWVTCLGVRRDDATGDWSIGNLSTARNSYTPAELNAPDSDASEFGPPALIESMRFVRADDGGIDLEVVHPKGDPTMLNLPRKVEEHATVTEPRISELLVDLIREDLAERDGDGG